MGLYLIPVVSPGAKFHETFLLVEGKVLDIDLACALVNGGRVPNNAPVIVNDGLGHNDHFVVAVSTGHKEGDEDEDQARDAMKQKGTGS